MIIATAGHVDHGKTTLIQALTGKDTDCLAEEKRRGLTIDLGFAWTRTEQGRWLGFVDVPGHEKFIRNMVAGVSAVDAVMLVVAADDGPMPQTREHLAILDLLGVQVGVVALTQADRVKEERLVEARTEVTQLLAGTLLADAPVFPVSGLTGQGVPALAGWLADRAFEHEGHPEPPSSGARLVVDRSFSVKGSGCVVTGTLIAGSLSREETLIVSPAGLSVRVRGLEMHGDAVDQVEAGQRCAVNLAGDISRAGIQRGDWLVAPWLHRPTDRVDVALTLLPEARLHRGTFQVHVGAAVRSAHVVMLHMPGQGGQTLVQLMLEHAVQACSGDRLILRDPAQNRTIGGGKVVDPFGLRRGRSAEYRVGLLKELAATQDPAVRMDAWLQARPEGVDLNHFAQAGNLPEASLEKLLESRQVVVLQTGDGRIGFDPAHWNGLQAQLRERLDRWHADYPDQVGLTEPELTQKLERLLPQPVRHGLLKSLLDSGAIARNGFHFHRPDHRPRLAAADQALLDRVMAELEGTGLTPPIAGELAEALRLSRNDMLAFLDRMRRLGMLVAVAPNRFYHPETATELAAIAVEVAENSPSGAFDARAYMDRSGIGRRLTISVLEYLDRAGVTAFINEQRRLQPAYRRQAAATLSNTDEKG